MKESGATSDGGRDRERTFRQSAVPGRPSPLDSFLLALQLTDSSFPSGLYTLSHGLEGLVRIGRIGRGAGTEAVVEVVEGMLRHCVGPGDATALALAWQAVIDRVDGDPLDPGTIQALTAIDRRAHVARLSAEVRSAATRTGRQVLDLAAEILDDPVVRGWNEHVRSKGSPGGLPVTMGVVYARGGLSRAHAVAADLAAFCTSVTGAALRLGLVDHRQAQLVVHSCAPVIEEVTAEALERPLHRLGGYCPVLDIATAHHEAADARLFAS